METITSTNERLLRKIQINPTKTYASHGNAQKAVEAAIKKVPAPRNNVPLTYFITMDEDGRFFPVFIGMSAVEVGMHFYFNCMAAA